MIDMYHKKRGYAVLAITLVVLLAVTLLAIFLTKTIVSDHHNTQNTYRIQQAKQAAIAGIEYGIKYAEANKDSITDGQELTGTLPNNASYSTVINFVSGNNESLNIVSTGSSVDGTVHNVIKREVKWNSGSTSLSLNLPLVVKGVGTLTGNAEVTNLESDSTIDTGSASISFTGNSKTTISSGTSSDSSGVGADVTLNDSTLAGYSNNELETSVLGDTIQNIYNTAVSSANTTYTGSGDQTYNTQLDGTSGKVIYINQNSGTVTLNSNTDIGTSSSPVTLVINGSISIAGNVEIYGDIILTGNISLSGNTTLHGHIIAEGSGNLSGNTDVKGLVFVTGDMQTSGNTDIDGGLAVGGAYSASGNTNIEYNSVNLSNGISTSGGYYGSIAGSWKDY